MISFDVVSLFTNVPLERTIDIIINKIYKKKLIKTKIKPGKMRALLLLCTKEGHFTFNDEIYQQVDGVMMGSPLGSLIANIFMCELENTLIPKLMDKVQHWTRYVDDTFVFVKPGTVDEIHQLLNSFDPKIKFTYEKENDKKISFLDVQLERLDNNTIETSVYRKPTNNDIFMNWFAYSPRSWKIGTLRSLIKRALMISSTDNILQNELKHLKKVFNEKNQYPLKVIESITDDEVQKHHEPLRESTEPTINEVNDEVSIVQLNLPFGGTKGEIMMKKLSRKIERINKNKVKLRVTYTPNKLSSKFPVKDKIKFAHQHNVSYYIDCANKKCKSDYVGQTKCRILKRTLQHNSKDNASHILQHSKATKHRRVTLDNVKILGKRYKSNFKRRISESLFIKELKPDLNKQKDAFRLKLFN